MKHEFNEFKVEVSNYISQSIRMDGAPGSVIIYWGTYYDVALKSEAMSIFAGHAHKQLVAITKDSIIADGEVSVFYNGGGYYEVDHENIRFRYNRDEHSILIEQIVP